MEMRKYLPSNPQLVKGPFQKSASESVAQNWEHIQSQGGLSLKETLTNQPTEDTPWSRLPMGILETGGSVGPLAPTGSWTSFVGKLN